VSNMPVMYEAKFAEVPSDGTPSSLKMRLHTSVGQPNAPAAYVHYASTAAAALYDQKHFVAMGVNDFVGAGPQGVVTSTGASPMDMC